jgi:hypothetical protein
MEAEEKKPLIIHFKSMKSPSVPAVAMKEM